MASQSGALQVGSWVKARNLAADVSGSIHDDAEARRLGLPGGLVPGNVQLVLVQRAVVDAFGPAWYERGSLSFSWARPVYDGEELRLLVGTSRTGLDEQRAISLVLQKRDGSPAAIGRAGLAGSPEKLQAPWKAAVAESPDAAADPLPEEPIGMEFPAKTIALDARQVEGALGGLDPNRWYTETSPWGGPILPTVAFLPFTGQGRRWRRDEKARTSPHPRSRIRAGMNGALDLLQTGPMFRDQPYERRMVVVAKGVGSRTAFRTLEVSLADTNGRQVALAHWKVNWFPRDNAARA